MNVCVRPRSAGFCVLGKVDENFIHHIVVLDRILFMMFYRLDLWVFIAAGMHSYRHLFGASCRRL